MAWIAVQAGQDHLLQFARRPAVDALTELIWNALDAEADHVEAHVFSDSLVPGDARTLAVQRVEVRDDGHGMSAEIAKRSFPVLGDSWKKGLNGRTVNGRRILHGHHGRGRFFAYAIGNRVRWTSTATTTDGTFEQLVVEGSASNVNGFNIHDPVASDGPSGTVVVIEVEQGRQVSRLLADDLHVQIAGRMAAHLLGNNDIEVTVNDTRVDPGEFIEGEPLHLMLDDFDPTVLHGKEIPVLTIVQWTDAMRDPLGVVMCNRDGASLLELPNTAIASPVRVTGYLKWSGFEESDLALAELEFPEVTAAARDRFQAFVRERTEELTATIVATLKAEGTYPYRAVARGAIEKAERETYDLILVAARNLLGQSRSQRLMSAQLLQLALQERPEALDAILEETLRLSADQRDQLAEMLKYSSIGRIVGAAAEVGRRLELLMTLRQLLYDPDESKRLREVDQLHPLVAENVWLFGEEWRLTASEAGLTNVLRNVIRQVGRDQDLVIEADMAREGAALVTPQQLRGRVDLLLQRTLDETDMRQRLVVELKRPSVAIGAQQVDQVRAYARALTSHGGVAPGRWIFWLVGATIHRSFEADMQQESREYGNLHRGAYELWVLPWSHLIQRAERRLNFFRDQLGYSIQQDEAVHRVHARYERILGESARRHGRSPAAAAPRV